MTATLPATIHPLNAWGNLTTSLSGPFCAALGQLAHPARWIATRLSDAHQYDQWSGGLTMHLQSDPYRHVQGWLPSEAICTENLVAWLRMLPCKDEAGAARLLRERALLYGAGVTFLKQNVHFFVF